MKRITFLLLTVFAVFTLKAQDTTKIIIGGKSIVIIGNTGQNKEINIDKMLDSIKIDEIDIDLRDTMLEEEERIINLETKIESKVEREVEKMIGKLEEVEDIEIDIIDNDDDFEYDDDDDDFECSNPDKSIAHWAGFEAGVNGWMNKDQSFDLANPAFDLDYSNSIFINLNIAEEKLPLFGGYGGLVTGLGFNFNSFSFKGNTSLSFNEDSTWAGLDNGVAFNKNKLNVTYLTIPLMFELNTNLEEDKSFHIGFGVQGGFKLLGKTKQKYEIDGEKYKTNVRGHYNINPWRADAIARVGYKNLTLFANYPLTQFFEKDSGPEMYTFQVGLRLIDF
ncbi:MAG: porin family protein [Bacteroidia bacterium]